MKKGRLHDDIGGNVTNIFSHILYQNNFVDI